jgi:hypothetical protein
MADRGSMLWLAAFVVVVTLAGAAGGVLIDRHILQPPPSDGRGLGQGQAGLRGGEPGMRGGGPGQGMRTPGWVVQRLDAQLHLTPPQRDKVVAILERRRARLDQIRTEMQGRMEGEQKQLRDEIRGILAPDQQKIFDEEMASPLLPGGPGQRRAGPGGRPPTRK